MKKTKYMKATIFARVSKIPITEDLIKFFELLLKIDKRLNLKDYKK